MVYHDLIDYLLMMPKSTDFRAYSSPIDEFCFCYIVIQVQRKLRKMLYDDIDFILDVSSITMIDNF